MPNPEKKADPSMTRAARPFVEPKKGVDLSMTSVGESSVSAWPPLPRPVPRTLHFAPEAPRPPSSCPDRPRQFASLPDDPRPLHPLPLPLPDELHAFPDEPHPSHPLPDKTALVPCLAAPLPHGRAARFAPDEEARGVCAPQRVDASTQTLTVARLRPAQPPASQDRCDVCRRDDDDDPHALAATMTPVEVPEDYQSRWRRLHWEIQQFTDSVTADTCHRTAFLQQMTSLVTQTVHAALTRDLVVSV